MILKKLPFTQLFFFFLIVIVMGAACQLPVQQKSENSAEPDLEATIMVLQTQMSEASKQAKEPGSKETLSPTDPSEIKQLDSSSTDLYQGFYALQEGRFRAYDFNGNSLGVDFPAGSSNWYGDNEINAFIDEIFYAEFSSNSGAFRVNAQGTQKFDFIEAQDPVYIAVSPDRQKIAWSTSSWGEGNLKTEIFYANLDGSNQQLIDVISANEQVDLSLNFFPVRWTDDGRLIYATGMTGIGGYMLFWGYNGMYVFNPLNNSIRTLVDDQERLGICLSSISDDLAMISIVCGVDNRVKVRNLSTGLETIFPILEDQVLAGAARFSPSGEWLAYVIQRADPMQELGKVVLVAVDGSQPPRVLTSVEDGSFTVEGWVSEDHFLVTRSYMSSGEFSVLKLSRDGGEVIQVAEGKYMDFIP
ncbi:MAG: hypothetical protein CVU41_15430 [Chloroflexi bacterium HGW-Chloroflexi-3]|nr:MAG: hypothetical protein CVU41_15430 [Chloroflexi bacterium HGW-Chloroflexi-3]